MAQTRTVTGIITDNNNELLPGVSVTVKGTVTGTVSNTDGRYSITVAASEAVLIFSFVGYQSSETIVGDRTVIDIVMLESSIAFDEVVVVGYGVQKKATLTGSIASVRGSDLIKTPAMNVSNTLAGTLPGLVVVHRSGEPGNDHANLYIRGRSSLNSNSPLIVVDGVPNRSLDRIDPATIESISVMKDASAAIYGSQAANGVILVTTKRGKDEKMTISASINQGWSRPTKVPIVCNAFEYATLANEIAPNTYSDEALMKYKDGSDPWRYPDTDWTNTVLKPWSPQTIANISMSGGTERLKAFVALSGRYQDGFFKNSAGNYGQYDLRANVDGQVNNYISLAVDFNGRFEDANFPTYSTARTFRSLSIANPTLVAVWPNGLTGPPLDMQNQTTPVIESTPLGGYDNRENYVFNVNVSMNIKIPWVEGLSFRGTAAFDRGLRYSKRFNKRYELHTWDGYTVDDNQIPVLAKGLYGGFPSLTQELSIARSYLVNTLLSYDRTFALDNAVNFLIGVEAIENGSNWFTAENRSFTAEFPDELNFGNSNTQYAGGSNPGTDRWLNYFGRVNYAYKSKYLLEFVWRYQGTSKFHKDTRWGFFPGISAGYRISEEDFWKSSAIGNTIDNFKLRASWGKTGNDRIASYQFFSLYSKPLFYGNYNYFDFVTGDGKNHQLIAENLAPNIQAQWEEANQMNVGLDMNLLNYRLSFTADYFNNLRTKILIPQRASVPEMTGLIPILPDINLGEVRNRGFDFEIAYSDKKGDFSYRVGFNGGYAKNKILFFDESPGMPDYQIQTGFPMNSMLLYEAIGIFRSTFDVMEWNEYARAKTGNPDAEYIVGAQPGDLIFKDVDDNGKIDGDDRKRVYKSGVPTLTGGLNFMFGYKNFDLSILLQGQAGAIRYYLPSGSLEYNFPKDFYDNRWTENTPNAKYPRTYNRNMPYWMSSDQLSTFWMRKTDFIRLKNFELGYNFPKEWINQAGINQLRLYIGGMNLFTYAPDMIDYDPETQFDGLSGEGYPLMKMINVGLSFKF